MNKASGSTGHGKDGMPSAIVTNSVGGYCSNDGLPKPLITNSVGAMNHAAKANGGIQRENPGNIK